jgi:asparagine synthase (glutamine-hydrolysing)
VRADLDYICLIYIWYEYIKKYDITRKEYSRKRNQVFMCGIVGFISKKLRDQKSLERMADCLKHRGPDDAGYFIDPCGTDYHVGLSHRRLSIMDLSDAGHQPMISDDQNIAVIFNGEIYNFRDVNAELESLGHVFKTDCDTETIVKAYQAWGIDFVSRLNGMFSIVVYDKSKETIYIARDRLGVKPLYYYLDQDGGIAFGSEMKPLMAYPGFLKKIDKHALSLFLYHGYITAPYTIFKNTYKLEPGKILTFTQGKIDIETYWSVDQKFRSRQIQEKSEKEWLKDLDDLLTLSIKERMVSDVPLGAFLSGGVDSSLVAAIMQKLSSKPIQTFTIGFKEKEYDEAPFAKAVSDHLGTNHTEQYLPMQDAEALVDKIVDFYDEPFADSSQIPTMMLCRLAKKDVTVCLSGDGGDEIFCGYGRYDNILKLQKCIPLAKTLNKIPFLRRFLQYITKNTKFSQLFELVDDHGCINKGYLNFVNHCRIIKDHTSRLEPRYDVIMHASNHIQEKHMLQDLITYMPDDILCKVDRASMAVSLETRVPFIDDHRVLELSLSMPHHLKYKEGCKKYILKQLLYKYVPKSLIDRPKKGFGLPIYQWLRTDLSYLLDKYLDDYYIVNQGIFDENYVQRLKKDFFSNTGKSFIRGVYIDRTIWHMIVFQMWYKKHMDEVHA